MKCMFYNMKPFKTVLESDSYNDKAGSERLTWPNAIVLMTLHDHFQFIVTKEENGSYLRSWNHSIWNFIFNLKKKYFLDLITEWF